MPSIFTRILAGELPAQFVWQDERVVAFLSINPLATGHTLVIPREEVDHWLDLPAELAAHCTRVAQTIGRALHGVYRPVKVGLMIAGLEVPHVHLHVTPIRGIHDMDFANQDDSATAEELDAAADRVRARLRTMGCEQVSD